jgi:hypothetical protein
LRLHLLPSIRVNTRRRPRVGCGSKRCSVGSKSRHGGIAKRRGHRNPMNYWWQGLRLMLIWIRCFPDGKSRCTPCRRSRGRLVWIRCLPVISSIPRCHCICEASRRCASSPVRCFATVGYGSQILLVSKSSAASVNVRSGW